MSGLRPRPPSPGLPGASARRHVRRGRQFRRARGRGALSRSPAWPRGSAPAPWRGSAPPAMVALTSAAPAAPWRRALSRAPRPGAIPVRQCNQCAHARKPSFQPVRASNSRRSTRSSKVAAWEARGQGGNGLAEGVRRLGRWLPREWRCSGCRNESEKSSGHAPSSHRSICCVRLVAVRRTSPNPSSNDGRAVVRLLQWRQSAETRLLCGTADFPRTTFWTNRVKDDRTPSPRICGVQIQAAARLHRARRRRQVQQERRLAQLAAEARIALAARPRSGAPSCPSAWPWESLGSRCAARKKNPAPRSAYQRTLWRVRAWSSKKPAIIRQCVPAVSSMPASKTWPRLDDEGVEHRLEAGRGSGSRPMRPWTPGRSGPGRWRCRAAHAGPLRSPEMSFKLMKKNSSVCR